MVLVWKSEEMQLLEIISKDKILVIIWSGVLITVG